MSDGQSDYESDLLRKVQRRDEGFWWSRLYDLPPDPPIVPRREMWTYTPPYFWLGKEAEAA